MIENFEKFHFLDKAKKHNFFIEVNYNPNDTATNQCKVLKVIFPDNSEAFIDKKLFMEMLFAIGDPEEQKKMIPQKLETVHWRKTVLGIKAYRDIRKGEMINFPIEISFPCTNKEIIGNIKKPISLKGQSFKDTLFNPKSIERLK